MKPLLSRLDLVEAYVNEPVINREVWEQARKSLGEIRAIAEALEDIKVPVGSILRYDDKSKVWRNLPIDQDKQGGWEDMQRKVILALKNRAWSIERELKDDPGYATAAEQLRDIAKAIESWTFNESEGASDG